MKKEEIKKALLDGAELAYNMVEVKHELYYDGDIFTVRCNTALQLKEELNLVPVKQVAHNRYKTDVMIIKNNTHMSQNEIKERLEKVNQRNEDNGVEVEVVELVEQVKKTGENTYFYRGSNVSVYGEASECNNMSIEGWFEDDEELSVIYAEGYNSYKQAVKKVIDDLTRRYGKGITVEELSFI